MTLWRCAATSRGDGLVFSGIWRSHPAGILPALAILFWLSQQSVLIRSADGALRDFLYSNLFPDAARRVMGLSTN